MISEGTKVNKILCLAHLHILFLYFGIFFRKTYFPANINLLQPSNRKSCEICSKSKIKILERRE